MLIEVLNTDLGIIPVDVTSQWQLLEFAINVPFTHHITKHCGYTAKVMNIHISKIKKTGIMACKNSTCDLGWNFHVSIIHRFKSAASQLRDKEEVLLKTDSKNVLTMITDVRIKLFHEIQKWKEHYFQINVWLFYACCFTCVCVAKLN